MTTGIIERIEKASALGLVLVGTMCLAGNHGAQVVQPTDPLTGFSSRYVLWDIGALCMILGGARLFQPRALWVRLLILWLVFSLALFRAGLWFMGVHTVRAYFDTMAGSFGLSPASCAWLFGLMVAFAFACSLRAPSPASAHLKTFCPNCGGHLEVASGALGQQRPCAHCGQLITLRAPSESLKTTCYFCKGHIEFPAHALGRKIVCPHCKKEISLRGHDATAGVT